MTKSELRSLGQRISFAVTKAVQQAIAEHHSKGQYVVVMQNGKLTKLYPPKKQS
jgi:hypothetical protein